MPLIIPELPVITDIRGIVGKKVIDDTSGNIVNPGVHDVIYKSQLPSNVVLIKQDVEHTAITGAAKSNLLPILVDEDDVVIKVF